MGKKKSKKAADNKNKPPKNKLLSITLVSGAISLVVVIISFVYLAVIERPYINVATIEKQSETLANSQVSLLDQALNQLRLRLTTIALNNDLLLALEQKDQAAIQRYIEELSRAFPEAVSTKLIPLGPLGIAAVDSKTSGLRNNIEFDLLRSVSNGENVEPEAYKADGIWLFSLAEPVRSMDKKYASAALLVSLDEKYLRILLGQLDNSQGNTALIQQFGSKQNIIASTGGNTNESTITVDTEVSHWRISFTPSSEIITQSSHSAIIVWSLLGLSILTIMITSIFAYKASQKLIANSAFVPKAPEKTDKPTKQKDSSEPPKAVVVETEKSDTPPTTITNDQAVAEEADTAIPNDIPETIFRAYDIRGLADEQLSDDIVYAIGLAIGSEALDQGQQTIVVAADGRHSSPRIRDAMVKGIQASGRDVIDIGIMPTPLMYFATHQLGTQSGVMITGSHNPSEYNGIKVVIGGRALSGNAISKLRERIVNRQLASGQGDYQSTSIEQDYIDYIINDVAIAQPLKVVIDAGNGVAGAIAPQLFEELGCEVIPLYCEVDGNFPNHHPDPSVEANLEDLKRTVKEQEADLGIAFDGDGDRLGVVTGSGKSIAADRLLMLLAQDVVSRNPGADVIFDVKCTRNLNSLISNFGGRPIMWKTGHSFMKEKMAETGALLGGEYSGHIFFKERWFGFDDGMYAAARLIEILSTTDPDLDLQLESFPETFSSPELKIETSEEQKFTIVEQLVGSGQFGDGKISTLDGVRVDFPDGWGLVRASNTTPMLILRFEADDQDALTRIQDQFKEQLSTIDNTLQFDF